MDPTTHPDWPAADHARASCRVGLCRYPSPEEPPNPWRGAQGCQGYAGTVHAENGHLVMRWDLCARQRAWWDAERHRLHARRQRDRRSHDAARRRGVALPGDEP